MPDTIERFATEYQQYHGTSEGRSREQLTVLRALEAHIGHEVVETTPDEFRSFLAAEAAAGRHPNTVRKKHIMVCVFFKWAFGVELIDGDRYLRLRAVDTPNGANGKHLPKPYSTKELDEFRAELDARYPVVEDRWWGRWRRGSSRYRRIGTEVQRRQIEAVVALALHCGLRQQEIYNLSLDDMHPTNAYVVVRQRADVANDKDKFREVPYTEAAREKVRRWIAVRDELNPPHDRPWIRANSRLPEGDWLLPMTLYRFARLLTPIGKRGPGTNRDYWRLHRFRHTSGTNWLRAGMPLEVVSRHLGHSNVQQTLGYAELVREDIQRAVAKSEGRFERLIGEGGSDEDS